MTAGPVGPGRLAPLLVLALAICGVPAEGQQTRWVVDPVRSLAWWQINPHLGHLWATTCPREPSWKPGEDLASGPQRLPTGYSATIDTVIPLYPRKWALPLCGDAVRGDLSTADTLLWTGTRGLIVVRTAALTIGQPIRDEYAHRAIFETEAHPDIRFTIDSVTDVQPGDTLRARVAGAFSFRGVERPIVAPARAWREAGGIRVTTRFDLDAAELTGTFGISKLALGLGVGLSIWKTVHAGVDVVLKPVP